MKPFVINRYGRIVFPFNFFPDNGASAGRRVLSRLMAPETGRISD